MIADWILHPFRHLQGGHTMTHHAIEGAPAIGAVRRLIFLRIDSPGLGNTRAIIFGITTNRAPLFFADVDMHNLVLLDIRSLGTGTGWGRVPTPMF
jgi:hypothetical protein